MKEGCERVRIVVHGRVQGVFFRDSTRRQASGLGLTGFVRNQGDGSVEIVAEGPRTDLELLVEWSRRGTTSAVVTGVDVEYGPATDEYSAFNIHYGL